MACCGGKRARIKMSHQENHPGELANLVYFQYTGKTGMTVIGSETHVRYRFYEPGVVIAVDVRDKHAMAVVPNLRQIQNYNTPVDG